ncbi:MAG: AraC family transcriptional regulator [Chthoniobacterales bacterium]
MLESSTYLPLVPERLAWGLAVVSTGFIRTPPNSVYPSRQLRHPDDHMFTWDRGRTLEDFQILTIRRGGGSFESRESGRLRLAEGSALLLFPGVWHRYRPDPQTGWTETWIEFTGSIPKQLRQAGILDPARPVFPAVLTPELTASTRSAIELSRTRSPGFAGQLAATTLQILAALSASRDRTHQPPSHVQQTVERAQTLLLERFDEPHRIRDVARELGIAESHLRRVFKKLTGLSPKEYVLDLRLREVRILLQGSTQTLAEIAERTGYNSAYHLSAEFKKRTGISPSHWRSQLHQSGSRNRTL